MENDRRRVRIVGTEGGVRGRGGGGGQSKDRVAKRDRDRLDMGGGKGRLVYERGESNAGNVRYNDVGSFTVVRHFGTCFPINMHVLVP